MALPFGSASGHKHVCFETTDFSRSLLDTCLHHKRSTMGAWLFPSVSPPIPSALHSLGSICLSATSTRRVLPILTACILIGDSCCVSCKSPSLLHFIVELLLHLFFLVLCSTPKKMSKVPLYFLMYFSSVLHVDPFNNVHLTIFYSFWIFLSSQSSCRDPLLIACPMLRSLPSDSAHSSTK